MSEISLYTLISPILRACVLTESSADFSQAEAQRKAAPLRAWVENELVSANRPMTLTDAMVLDKLKETANELAEWVEDMSEAELTSGYKQLKFIHHLLCEPPTVIGLLARTFQVDGEQVTDWLSDHPRSAEASIVARRILYHLRDLCGEPEDPQAIAPEAPLQSFDDLKFLGSLRQAFGSLYHGNRPKIAQAQFIPEIIKCLEQRFFGGGNGRIVVVAPTNGGKNGMILVAALAAIAWDEGPVLVLQPYRAQIAESQRSWSGAVARRPVRRRRKGVTKGLRIAGSSALISDFDFDIVRGRIDITAIIPEKLAVLSRNRELKSLCNLLVADEIGQLLTAERGPKLEIMLTLAKMAGISIMATGAALSNTAAEYIAKWLGDLPGDADPRATGRLLFDPDLRRDPPIEYWVWRRDGKRRFWHEGMGALDTMEADVAVLPDNEEDAVADLVIRELKSSPERQILVFLENRQKVVDLADNIARQLRGPEVKLARVLDDIANDVGTSPLGELWLGGSLPSPVDMSDIITQRVGVHTRDVPSNNLEQIEDAFRSGRLRILCATTTVEAGINLPVDTVVQVGLLNHDQRKLSQRALEQRLGRSGRTIYDRSQPGKGIVYIHDNNQLIERVIKERILRQDESFSSHLNEAYRALLLLAYVGSTSDKTDEDLERVLGQSYWAYGKRPDEIKSATQAAISSLRQEKLIEPVPGPVEDESVRAWSAMPLGQAISAALLLPGDAKAISGIVRTAESAAANDAWLPEVLYAACKVPSIISASRRPREEDILSKPPMTQRAVIRSWVRREGDGNFSFGFPRKKARMSGGVVLEEVLLRLHEGRPRPLDERAVLRTYICWLWTQGQSLDVKPYVRHLSEHVVQQDLAYYLSHVLRAASWLAQYEGKYVISLRLRELSREVEFGVPPAAVTFFEICHEHVTRQQVSMVGDLDFKKLLLGLEPRVADDLARRLDIKRERRHSRALNAALDAGAIENEDERVRFDRMVKVRDVFDRLRAVWDEDAGPLSVVNDRLLRAGPCLIEVARTEIDSSLKGEAEIVVSVQRLAESVQLSRSPRSVSLLGSEEFVVLVTRLAGLTGRQQALLLLILARVQRVCYGEMIEALEAQISGEQQRDLDESPDLPRVALDHLVRKFAATLRILFPSKDESESRTSTDNSPVLEQYKSALNNCIESLLLIINDNLSDRFRAVGSTKREAESPAIRAKINEWQERRQVVLGLREKIEAIKSTAEASALLISLNKFGQDNLGTQWSTINISPMDRSS